MRHFIRLHTVTLVVCLGILGCESSTPPADKWADHTQGLPFVVGYDQGRAAAAAQGKPAMMFITTTWCGWCKKLANESFNNPEIRDLLANFVCVIVDGDTESDAMRQLAREEVSRRSCLSRLTVRSWADAWATFRPRSSRASLRKLSAKRVRQEGRSVRAQLNNLRGGATVRLTTDCTGCVGRG